MEENPTYDTSGSLLHAFVNHGEDIYTDPDDRFNEQSVYEAVYSDASVQPSLFKKQMNERMGEKEKQSGWLESAANYC